MISAIRFVDFGTQLGVDDSGPREFGFYNTLSGRFMDFKGLDTFESWEDFVSCFYPDGDQEMLERIKLLNLPRWIFEVNSLGSTEEKSANTGTYSGISADADKKEGQ